MEFTDYMIIKFVVVCVGAFVYGLVRGLSGLPLSRGQSGTSTAQRQEP